MVEQTEVLMKSSHPTRPGIPKRFLAAALEAQFEKLEWIKRDNQARVLIHTGLTAHNVLLTIDTNRIQYEIPTSSDVSTAICVLDHWITEAFALLHTAAAVAIVTSPLQRGIIGFDTEEEAVVFAATRRNEHSIAIEVRTVVDTPIVMH